MSRVLLKLLLKKNHQDAVIPDQSEAAYLLLYRAMFVFKHGGRRAAHIAHVRTQGLKLRRASRIEIPKPTPPFPVIEACPVPTCQCREMPGGLEIEREQNINGSIAAYAEQCIISTGRSDWKSRIEEEDEGVLVKQLKSLLTRGGKYSDVGHSESDTTSTIDTKNAEAIPQRTAH